MIVQSVSLQYLFIGEPLLTRTQGLICSEPLTRVEDEPKVENAPITRISKALNMSDLGGLKHVIEPS